MTCKPALPRTSSWISTRPGMERKPLGRVERLHPAGNAVGPNGEIAVRVGPGAASGNRCEREVDFIAVSIDGGASWQRRTPPGGPRPTGCIGDAGGFAVGRPGRLGPRGCSLCSLDELDHCAQGLARTIDRPGRGLGHLANFRLGAGYCLLPVFGRRRTRRTRRVLFSRRPGQDRVARGTSRRAHWRKCTPPRRFAPHAA